MVIQQNTIIRMTPRYLWFLLLSYSMVMVLANWFDPRLISFWGITTDAGTLIFPLSFLLSDLITEVYGYKHARRAIWCGFLFNILFILYGQIVIHMPSPSYATHNSQFDALFNLNMRIILASMISYFSSEPLNALLLAKIKISMQGRYMGIRFISSTFIASGIDSAIFGSIAFYGLMSNQHLFSLIMTMWLIKVSIEILGLPISITLAKKLKAIEHLDIYDTHTQFNLLKLEANYSSEDNRTKVHSPN